MNKSFTSVADLLTDESFIGYCLEENDENVHLWKEYLHANPEQKPLVEEAKKTFFLLRKGFAEADMETQLEQLKSLVAKQKESSEQFPPVRKTKKVRRFPGILRYAAAAAAVVFIALATYQYFGRQDGAYQVYISEVGNRKTIVLTDSSHVILNSNSILKVPEEFNKQNREVLLSGAAFFEVTHDAEHPFSVTTEGFVTKVLGTTFFVRDYHSEANTSVLLLTGKVKVAAISQNKDVELKPGEKVSMNRKNGQFRVDDFDEIALINWKTGRLAFNNAPFEKVVRKLELWYGVEISVHGARNDLHFTGRFDNESLENILKVIGFTMNCQYNITENQVNIHF